MRYLFIFILGVTIWSLSIVFVPIHAQLQYQESTLYRAEPAYVMEKMVLKTEGTGSHVLRGMRFVPGSFYAHGNIKSIIYSNDTLAKVKPALSLDDLLQANVGRKAKISTAEETDADVTILRPVGQYALFQYAKTGKVTTLPTHSILRVEFDDVPLLQTSAGELGSAVHLSFTDNQALQPLTVEYRVDGTNWEPKIRLVIQEKERVEAELWAEIYAGDFTYQEAKLRLSDEPEGQVYTVEPVSLQPQSRRQVRLARFTAPGEMLHAAFLSDEARPANVQRSVRMVHNGAGRLPYCTAQVLEAYGDIVLPVTKVDFPGLEAGDTLLLPLNLPSKVAVWQQILEVQRVPNVMANGKYYDRFTYEAVITIQNQYTQPAKISIHRWVEGEVDTTTVRDGILSAEMLSMIQSNNKNYQNQIIKKGKQKEIVQAQINQQLVELAPNTNRTIQWELSLAAGAEKKLIFRYSTLRTR